MTIKDLSHLTGIQYDTLMGYEKLRSMPGEENADKIAEALGKDTGYLFPTEYGEIVQFVARERGLRRSPLEKAVNSVNMMRGLTVKQQDMIKRHIKRVGNPISLERQTDYHETAKIEYDFLKEHRQEDMEAQLTRYFSVITDLEQAVLVLKYGLSSEWMPNDMPEAVKELSEQTQQGHDRDEIGKAFNLPREKIVQIEGNAIGQIQKIAFEDEEELVDMLN